MRKFPNRGQIGFVKDKRLYDLGSYLNLDFVYKGEFALEGVVEGAL